MRKNWWKIAIPVFLIAGFVTYRALAAGRASAQANVQTATVQRGTITATTSAAGTVRSNQSATINWQINGKVGEVLVQLGAHVKSGDELSALDPTSVSQSVIQAQTDLINARQALEDLLKPQPLKVAQAQSDLDQAQQALDNLLHPSETVIAQAEKAVIDAQSALDTAQKAVNALKYARASDEVLASARAGYLLAQDKVDKLQDIYDHTSGSPDEDAAKALALSNLEAAKTERNRALAQLNWYQGKPTDAEINEKNNNLALAQGQLADAQATQAKLQSPTSADIALAQAKVQDAQETLDNLKNGPTSDEITAAQARVTLAESTLGQAKLTAPFDGAVTDIQVMPGDMVSPGKAAFRIDDLSKLSVDLDVSEIDISQIKVGQAASLSFDAAPSRQYSGVVTSIGLVGSVSQGVVNYPVTVQITDADEDIKPGMTAAVSIVVAEHENVLIVPNQAVRVSGNQRTVVVLFEGQQITVPVTIGLTSDTMSEVTGNALKESDEVLISASSAASTQNFPAGGGFIGGGFIR